MFSNQFMKSYFLNTCMRVVVGIVNYKQQYGWEKFLKIKKIQVVAPSLLFSVFSCPFLWLVSGSAALQ